MEPIRIRKAAVLGAGVMGAQIAAHLANAGFSVELFDLKSDSGTPNQVGDQAIERLKKLEPSPLATTEVLSRIRSGNYDDHLDRLRDCDLVIEAVAERVDIKRSLFAKITPALSAHAIVATNTSGLSINTLAKEVPESLRPNFLGIHFFNPPRYMPLVELIPTTQTLPEIVDALEIWLTQRIGKSVIRAKDTPNFIANRIGVFSLLATMRHTEAFGLGLDTVDALTGPRIGRPKSASYRTVDVVGIDTLAHVVTTMRDQLPNDPWHSWFALPSWIEALVKEGALGQKTGRGLYKKEGREILVLDPASGSYRKSQGEITAEVDGILKIADPAKKFAALRQSEDPQAKFLWAVFRDVFHYSAYHLHEIADNARDLDLALRWGFGWTMGPLEIWQAAGWQTIAQAIADDMKAGRAVNQATLPAWVTNTARQGVHTPNGSFSPAKNVDQPRSSLPVYKRQRFPETCFGEKRPSLTPASLETGETVYENSGVRLWRDPTLDAGIGILSFKSKMHTVGDDVLIGLLAALAHAERHLDGVVLWHEPPFSVGANLKQVSEACSAGAWDQLETMVANFQAASQALKYCTVPVVAAAQGMALGGGCEFLMHAHHRVMHLETYAGLVEAGVGLIPAGGGCKEFAVRAAHWASQSPTPTEVFPFIQQVFMPIAMAKVAKSAADVVRMGFGKQSDQIVFHAQELLSLGIRAARQLADTGYAPPAPAKSVIVSGRTGIANLEMILVNMHAGRMISDHDYRVAKAAATALCGGDIEPGSRVDEAWLITIERAEFMTLLKTPETQARIKHMLETGKPLRN